MIMLVFCTTRNCNGQIPYLDFNLLDNLSSSNDDGLEISDSEDYPNQDFIFFTENQTSNYCSKQNMKNKYTNYPTLSIKYKNNNNNENNHPKPYFFHPKN